MMKALLKKAAAAEKARAAQAGETGGGEASPPAATGPPPRPEGAGALLSPLSVRAWRVGDACEALWTGDNEWYPASVRQVLTSGRLGVVFQGFDEFNELPSAFVRRPRDAKATKAATDVSSASATDQARMRALLASSPRAGTKDGADSQAAAKMRKARDSFSEPVSATPSLRARLVAFYERENPEQLAKLDAILEAYRGREPELLQGLALKYGRAPVKASGLASVRVVPVPPPQPQAKTAASSSLAGELARRVGLADGGEEGAATAAAAGGGLAMQPSSPSVLGRRSPQGPGMQSPVAGGQGQTDGSPVPLSRQTSTGTVVLGASPSQQQQAREAQLRERLVAFYRIHNPTHVGTIDRIMQTYRGKERLLWRSLYRKYGLDEHGRPLKTTPQPEGLALGESAYVAVSRYAQHFSPDHVVERYHKGDSEDEEDEEEGGQRADGGPGGDGNGAARELAADSDEDELTRRRRRLYDDEAAADAAAGRAEADDPFVEDEDGFWVAQAAPLRQQLVVFYTHFKPSNVALVDQILDHHRGKRDRLVQQLETKYAMPSFESVVARLGRQLRVQGLALGDARHPLRGGPGLGPIARVADIDRDPNALKASNKDTAQSSRGAASPASLASSALSSHLASPVGHGRDTGMGGASGAMVDAADLLDTSQASMSPGALTSSSTLQRTRGEGVTSPTLDDEEEDEDEEDDAVGLGVGSGSPAGASAGAGGVGVADDLPLQEAMVQLNDKLDVYYQRVRPRHAHRIAEIVVRYVHRQARLRTALLEKYGRDIDEVWQQHCDEMEAAARAEAEAQQATGSGSAAVSPKAASPSSKQKKGGRAGSPRGGRGGGGDDNGAADPPLEAYELDTASVGHRAQTDDQGRIVALRPDASGYTPDLRDIVEHFYKTENPKQLADLDTIFAVYEGRDALLLQNLEIKYGVNPLEAYYNYYGEQPEPAPLLENGLARKDWNPYRDPTTGLDEAPRAPLNLRLANARAEALAQWRPDTEATAAASVGATRTLATSSASSAPGSAQRSRAVTTTTVSAARSGVAVWTAGAAARSGLHAESPDAQADDEDEDSAGAGGDDSDAEADGHQHHRSSVDLWAAVRQRYPDALMCGFLKKKSPKGLPGMHPWQERLFVLDPSTCAMVYYKSLQHLADDNKRDRQQRETSQSQQGSGGGGAGPHGGGHGPQGLIPMAGASVDEHGTTRDSGRFRFDVEVANAVTSGGGHRTYELEAHDHESWQRWVGAIARLAQSLQPKETQWVRRPEKTPVKLPFPALRYKDTLASPARDEDEEEEEEEEDDAGSAQRAATQSPSSPASRSSLQGGAATASRASASSPAAADADRGTNEPPAADKAPLASALKRSRSGAGSPSPLTPETTGLPAGAVVARLAADEAGDGSSSALSRHVTFSQVRVSASPAADLEQARKQLRIPDGDAFFCLGAYEPQGQFELRMAPNDRLIIWKRDSSGWWLGHNCETSERGWLPSTYVRRAPYPHNLASLVAAAKRTQHQKAMREAATLAEAALRAERERQALEQRRQALDAAAALGSTSAGGGMASPSQVLGAVDAIVRAASPSSRASRVGGSGLPLASASASSPAVAAPVIVAAPSDPPPAHGRFPVVAPRDSPPLGVKQAQRTFPIVAPSEPPPPSTMVTMTTAAATTATASLIAAQIQRSVAIRKFPIVAPSEPPPSRS